MILEIALATSHLHTKIEDVKTYSNTEMEKAVQSAKSTRPANAEEALLGRDAREVETKAGEQIWIAVTDYTKGGNLEGSISNFLEQNLKIGPTPLEVLKKDVVFAAKEQGVVVKAFPKMKGSFHEFVREISSSDIMKDLKLSFGSSVAILGVGKCSVNGVEHLLLAMTLAPGKEIERYVDAIFNSSDRASAIQTCKRILSHYGKSLAELHKQKVIQANGTPEVLKITSEYTKQKIEKYLGAYKKKGGKDSEEIEKFFQRQWEKYDATVFYFTLHHGNPHLENALYDESSDKTVFIDINRMHMSVDQNGTPLVAEYQEDVARAEDELARVVLSHEMNESLITELTEAFHEGYVKEAGGLYIPSHFEMEKAFRFFYQIRMTFAWETVSDEKKREYKHRIHDYYLSYFLNSVEQTN